MPRVTLTLALFLSLVASASSTWAQPMPPPPGHEVPASIRDAFTRDKTKFQFKHAWIEKARLAKENRERFIEERGFYKRDMMASYQHAQHAVTGTLSVPVFCVRYSDSPPGNPFPISQLQAKLFTGPYSPQTLTQYYNEISFGDLNLTGTVYGWYTLPQTNEYYAGPGTCYGLCETAHMYQLVQSTIAASDAAVNFGQYDNDGPDGIPNSGDDDGYVDFAAFVHPEMSGACNGGTPGNIWSHRSAFNPGILTNDARAGGGLIRVSDYVIQPVYNCDNSTLIEIGVFCHEFGHALGLPDLYDIDGGSRGVGYWCLMGEGMWNTPSQPAHMGAWSLGEMGWADVDEVQGPLSDYLLTPVANSRTVWRVNNPAQKFRWAACGIGADKALSCNLTLSEANKRNWASPGYGNEWDVSASRDFNYNGSGAVYLDYDCEFDLEPNYDWALVNITVGNTTTTLATYTGEGSSDVEHPINITPYLTPAGPYTISFHVQSDVSNSDEDGGNPTNCGVLNVWHVSVYGGGENYSTLFQDHAGGWAQDPLYTEYFLVENRQPIGSDIHLPGSGLLIWHVDQASQSGGIANNRPRGVEVEQADGLGHLEADVNSGDAGDPFPGTSNKMLFAGGTTPNSTSHSNGSSVWIQLLTGNGNNMIARMFGGFGPPDPVEVDPPAGESGDVVQLQIDGSSFVKTPTVELVLYVPEEEELQHGVVTVVPIPAFSVEWLGHNRILANFDLTDAPNGLFNIVVHNPGGTTGVIEAVFTISGAIPTPAGKSPLEFSLSPAYPNPFNPTTTIRFEVPTREHVALTVYDVGGALVRKLVNEEKAPGSYSLQWNGTDDKGRRVSSGVYFYKITAGEFTDVRKMTLLK